MPEESRRGAMDEGRWADHTHVHLLPSSGAPELRRGSTSVNRRKRAGSEWCRRGDGHDSSPEMAPYCLSMAIV